MNDKTTTVFDLSPSEKLQLVEDLWDDLASTPEAIPIHEWRKKELARRKPTWPRTLLQALTWEEVKKRIK